MRPRADDGRLSLNPALTRCRRRRRRWRRGRPPPCACCACGETAAVRKGPTRGPRPPFPRPAPPGAHRAPTNSSQGGRRRQRCTVSKGPKLRVRYSTLSEQLWSKSTLGATLERPAAPPDSGPAPPAAAIAPARALPACPAAPGVPRSEPVGGLSNANSQHAQGSGKNCRSRHALR